MQERGHRVGDDADQQGPVGEQQHQGNDRQRPDGERDPQGDPAQLAVAGHDLGAARDKQGQQDQQETRAWSGRAPAALDGLPDGVRQGQLRRLRTGVRLLVIGDP